MRRPRGEIRVHDHLAQYRPVQFRSLTEDQILLLHEASLEIMARTGMRFHEEEALDLFSRERADQKVRGIIEEHRVEPLPLDVVDEIKTVLQRI